MSRWARAYVWVHLLVGAALAVAAITSLPPVTPPWHTFIALLALAMISQFLEARATEREPCQLAILFFFAGAILLPPALFVTLVGLSHLAEWAWERRIRISRRDTKHLWSFRAAAHIIAGTGSRLVLLAFTTKALPTTPLAVLAGTLAALSYALLVHLLTGQATVLVRGTPWRVSGIVSREHLLTDYMLLCFGQVLAALYRLNPALAVPALSALILMRRALQVPQLTRDAQTDPKTGLLNARRFVQVFEAELKRARRLKRPLSLIMADLDLLRNINNTYGHLAGDKVLATIGEIIRGSVRAYDLAARFGGEEFIIVLPEAEVEQGRAFAERLRKAVEGAAIRVAETASPIRVTLSLGVAAFPADATSAITLIHEGDVAVLQAKLWGRNRVVRSEDVPAALFESGALRQPHAAPEDRLAFPFDLPFTPRPNRTTL